MQRMMQASIQRPKWVGWDFQDPVRLQPKVTKHPSVHVSLRSFTAYLFKAEGMLHVNTPVFLNSFSH